MIDKKYKRICEYCNKIFYLNPRLGLKWAEKTGRGKFCSVECKKESQLGKRFSPKTEFKSTLTIEDWKNHPRFIDGVWSYRRFLGDRCELCGSINNLIVHHKDGNRHNNQEDNLITACAKCHHNVLHKHIFYGNQYISRKGVLC